MVRGLSATPDVRAQGRDLFGPEDEQLEERGAYNVIIAQIQQDMKIFISYFRY